MIKRLAVTPLAVMVVGLLLLSAAACSNQGSTPDRQAASPGSSEPSMIIITSVPSTNVPGATNQTQTRIVLKDASLSLIVDDAAKSAVDIGKMAAEMNGWVVNSDSRKVTSNDQTYTQASIVVRVPAERLDEAVARIKTGAISVESEKQTGQDVTQQYTDLQSKITNLEAAEAQLRKIMDNASQTTDVLAVYNQLVQVRGDIETAKGQAKFYEQSAAFSSITVLLAPKQDAVSVDVRGWSPLDAVKSAVNLLTGTLQLLINLLIWLVIYVLPLVIIVGAPAYGINRVILPRFRRFISTSAPGNITPPQPPVAPTDP